MPRRPRAFLPGTPVHLIQRGNNRQVSFFKEVDYIVYLDKLREASLDCQVDIHSFVLMTNHVHLLCTPTSEQGISLMMQKLGRYYVRYVNEAYGRTGTLWEGRFKASSMVNSEQYLLTVSRYIELNPVRAGMVTHPAEYPWSSYRSNALGLNIRMIKPHPVYKALGQSSSQREQSYRTLFDSQIPDFTLEEIRVAANKSCVLGDGRFKQQIECQLGRTLPPFPRGGDRKSTRFLQSAVDKRIKVL